MLKTLFSRRNADETDVDMDIVADEAKVTARREQGGLSIGRLTLTAFLLSAAVMGGLAFLSYLQLQALVEAQHQAAVAVQGERLAAEISGRIQGMAEVVENIARQTALAEAMTGGDPAALASRAEAVASATPGALRVRFLPLGTTATEEDQVPRLGYAGLDLAREVEKGNRPPLEVHWFGQADQHIALARPIGTPPQPAGVLLVAFDLGLMERWLQAALPEGGYAEIRQSTGDTQVVLASRGDTLLQGAPPTARVKLGGTTWELNYWLPAQGAALSTGTRLGFLGLFAGAALALGLVFLTLGATIRKLLHSDLDGLVRHVFDLPSRKREHGYSARLRDFRTAVQMLDEHVHLPPQPDMSEGLLAPEDPLFMRDGNMSVEEVASPGDRKE